MENDEILTEDIEEVVEVDEVFEETAAITVDDPESIEGSSTLQPVYENTSPEEYYDVIYTAVNDALIAQTVTDGQSISNTALEYFKGILLNKSPFTDYVVYVGEPYQYWQGNMERTAYEYCLAYGDLELTGQTFSGSADIVTMRTTGENTVSFVNDQYITLTAPMYYSRSNLGDYSGIVVKDYSGIGILLALALGGAVWLVKSFLVPKS